MKILGVDIGSHSIKVVQFEISFGRLELQNYFQESVVEYQLQTQASDHAAKKRRILSQTQVNALQKIFTQSHIQYDRIVLNFPKGWTTSRIFSYPTKDRKTIQNSLAFELEDELPFSMDEIVYDFSITGYSDSRSTVFTALALKEDLRDLVSELQNCELDPDIITIEPWGFGQLLKRTIPAEYVDHPCCVINLGHQQTSVQIYQQFVPVLSHTCHIGGLHITRAIAEKYQLNFEQAENAKIQGAFLITETHRKSFADQAPLSSEQEDFSATIAEVINAIVREIKQSLMSHKSQFPHPPRVIFITGGTSLIANLQLYLEENLKLPVFNLPYMTRLVGQTLKLSTASEAIFSVATGMAVSGLKVDRNVTINLRQDEFGKSTGLGAIDFNLIRTPLKYIAASLIFIYLNLFAQGLILSSRSENQDAQFERSIKAVLGGVSSSVLANYKNSESMLKKAVQKELLKYQEVSVELPSKVVSAYEVLNKVSAEIPKDMKLDVNVFEIKDGRFKLIGQVDLLENQKRIASTLESMKNLKDIKIDKSAEDPKTKAVQFELSAQVISENGGSNVKTR